MRQAKGNVLVVRGRMMDQDTTEAARCSTGAPDSIEWHSPPGLPAYQQQRDAGALCRRHCGRRSWRCWRARAWGSSRPRMDFLLFYVEVRVSDGSPSVRPDGRKIFVGDYEIVLLNPHEIP